MGAGDEVVDLRLVVLEEGVDVVLVDDPRALRLRQDEVEQEAQADVAVERNPGGGGGGRPLSVTSSS